MLAWLTMATAESSSTFLRRVFHDIETQTSCSTDKHTRVTLRYVSPCNNNDFRVRVINKRTKKIQYEEHFTIECTDTNPKCMFLAMLRVLYPHIRVKATLQVRLGRLVKTFHPRLAGGANALKLMDSQPGVQLSSIDSSKMDTESCKRIKLCWSVSDCCGASGTVLARRTDVPRSTDLSIIPSAPTQK